MNLIKMDGNLSKSLTAPDTSISTSVVVGQMIPVGEFFWVSGFIGYDANAKHGHGLNGSPGSADANCTLEVRAVNETHAIVRLHRPEMPYGAEAPIGTVFQISLDQIEGWPEKIRARRDRESQREQLALRYCQ